MEFKGLSLVFLIIGCAAAQTTYRVCISSNFPTICQSLETGNSQVACQTVESRIDCALKLSRGDADIGYFSEEEVLLLAQQQPSNSHVVATVRDVSRMEPFAFEAVAVVPGNHTGGLAGLHGGAYCHPGLDEVDQRWSPRVLKALEVAAVQTDRCPDVDTNGKTAEQIELETLSSFFSAACRPGAWSANATQDINLKSQHPSLCSLCGGSSCAGYSLDMGVSISGVRNENRHIQALECLRVNSNADTPAVAYAAWLHVREYFTIRNPQDAASYALLCPDGSVQPLSAAVLNNATAPCAFVRQPWGAIVASTNSAASVLASLRTWWPTGASPAGSSWQAVLFSALAGGANARVVFEDAPQGVLNYSAPIRPITDIDASPTCLPARRWCTLSPGEQTKCSWLRAAAHTLGVQPAVSCQQRASVLDCLKDIKENRADFISSPSNYGYLARRHYHLAPVKLVQNQRVAATRIAAFIKESSALSNITRFENLRGAKACFPEYGGLAYVAFVRAGQERGVLSASECDYARAVGDFFSGACAPGAEDASHALSESTYDAANLCSVCKPANTGAFNGTDSICTWDYSNKYFGNNGSLACLADPETDVAFLNTQNISAYLTALNLQGSSLRALCRNNSLAISPGVTIDDNCALAYVVDAEVVTRRNDPFYNSLNVLFDTLDQFFGYNAAISNQLINLELFSAFDGVSNLLFKDSTIGLTEPTEHSTHEPARNYIELFRHLDGCTASAPGLAAGIGSLLSLVVLSLTARFIIN